MTKENPIRDDAKYRLKTILGLFEKMRALDELSKNISRAEVIVSKAEAELKIADYTLDKYYSEYASRSEEIREINSKLGPVKDLDKLFSQYSAIKAEENS